MMSRTRRRVRNSPGAKADPFMSGPFSATFAATLQHLARELERRFAPVALVIHHESACREADCPPELAPLTRSRPHAPAEPPGTLARFFIGAETDLACFAPDDFWEALKRCTTGPQPVLFAHPFAPPGATTLAEAALLRVPRAEIRLTDGDEVTLECHAWSLPLEDLAPVLELQTAAPPSPPLPSVQSGVRLDMPRIVAAIEEAQRLMIAGHCYLLNHSERAFGLLPPEEFRCSTFVQRWLARPARFGAFYSSDAAAILCHSPERFVKIHGEEIVTEPIKGTAAAPDGTPPGLHEARQLWSSEKEINEQLLVVDLLRNDLNGVCVPGSVEVSRPFFVRFTPRLAQMQSIVSGRLHPRFSAATALERLLPAGSVTGTPKERVCQIIARLEATPRGYYTGVMGVADGPARLESFLLIRSHFRSALGIYAGTGAGITTLSDPHAEAKELEHKLRSFLPAGARP